MTSFTPGTRNPFRRESYSLGIDPAIFHSVSAPVDPASIPIPEETEDADHIFELDGAAAVLDDSPTPQLQDSGNAGSANGHAALKQLAFARTTTSNDTTKNVIRVANTDGADRSAAELARDTAAMLGDTLTDPSPVRAVKGTWKLESPTAASTPAATDKSGVSLAQPSGESLSVPPPSAGAGVGGARKPSAEHKRSSVFSLLTALRRQSLIKDVSGAATPAAAGSAQASDQLSGSLDRVAEEDGEPVEMPPPMPTAATTTTTPVRSRSPSTQANTPRPPPSAAETDAATGAPSPGLLSRLLAAAALGSSSASSRRGSGSAAGTSPQSVTPTPPPSAPQRRRSSFAHPGIPTVGMAGPLARSTAGVVPSRRASVTVRNGAITLEGLSTNDAVVPPSVPASPAESARRRSSHRMSIFQSPRKSISVSGGGVGRRSSKSPEPGVSGTSSSGGAALLKNGSCSESSELGSIASFESAAEFPEGCLLGFSECAEVLTPLALQVEGNIPDWVSGVFYRCGPGKFEVETELPSSEGDGRVVAIDHWFDGFSLLHRFEVRGGQVFYRNRFTSETQESVMKTTGALPLSFAQSQDPCKSMFKKFFTISLAIPTEFNVNVSVTPGFPVRYPRPGTDDTGNGEWRQILLAKTDANILQELDAETLQPRGYTAYTKMNPKFVGIMTSAHEHYDTTTGEYINFLQDPGPVISTHVFTVNAAHPKGGEVVCTLRTRRASYMHSFAVTQRYIILICCPYYWSMGGIPIVFTHTVASALEWHEHVPVYMYVIDRASKRHVATYQADPFFVFHTINAYDVVYKRTSATADAADAAAADGGAEPVDEDIDIVIDLCAYRSPSNIQEMYLDKFRSGTTDFEASHLRRYTLRGVRTVASRSALGASTYRWWQAMAGWMWPSGDPAVAASATPGPGGSGYPRATYDIRSGPGPELPVIHPDYFRRADYQFAFCVVASARMPFEALVKINVRTRAAVEWRVPGCYPSEPVVVPRPREAGGTGAEDDAVVLSVVLDGNARQTFLLVLDARTFKEIGRASMNTGRVVPFGFHGVYAPMPYDPLAQGKPTVIKTAEMDESEEV
ncbi:hypothetical protein H9P43_005169 [Blastocladiella emersonii ATCC 22665]|nr:hypothetical protein H9P43_005169 [Blastocladiella emersonii ATCC 22665]